MRYTIIHLFKKTADDITTTMTDLSECLFKALVFLTTPIWIIPYNIVKNYKPKKKKAKNVPAPYNCKCVVHASSSDERVRQSKTQPRAIYQSYNSHDCEAWYKCPVCNELFSSWSVYHQSKNENGTNEYCPKCKKELSGLD